MKNHAILLFLFVFSSAINAQSLNDSLLIYYPFNGNTEDLSGNDFDGIVVNATLTSDRSGNANSAYYFNGVNSYITLPLVSRLKPQLPLSFSFWVRFDDIYSIYSQIFRTDYNLDSYTGILFGLNPTTYQLQETYGDGTPGVTSLSSRRTKIGQMQMQAGVWYFVVGVIRGALDMDLYINCRNDSGTYVGSGGAMSYSSNPGSLGRTDAAGVNPYYFKGALDEFRYWHRALTEDDVDELCSLTTVENTVLSSNNQESFTFPNPTEGLLNIKSEVLNEETEFTISDILGQKVIWGMLSPIDNNTIDVSALNAGIYYLEVVTENRILNSQFIKR